MESSPELRIQRLESCERTGRGEEDYRRREGTWLVSDRKTSVDGSGPKLQRAVLVKILPHSWQSFPVFCLPMDREGRGVKSRVMLSGPALPCPPSHEGDENHMLEQDASYWPG